MADESGPPGQEPATRFLPTGGMPGVEPGAEPPTGPILLPVAPAGASPSWFKQNGKWVAAAVVIAVVVGVIVVLTGSHGTKTAATSPSSGLARSELPLDTDTAPDETVTSSTSALNVLPPDTDTSSLSTPDTTTDSTDSTDEATSDSTSAPPAVTGPAWCVAGNADASSTPEYPDVLDAGAPVSGLTDALADLAAVPDVAAQVSAISADIAKESPAPASALEALGRIQFIDPQMDVAKTLAAVDDTVDTDCSMPAFDDNAVSSALSAGPTPAAGSVDNIYGAFGTCSGQDDSHPEGVVSQARSVVFCGSQVVLTSLITGALTSFPTADGGPAAYAAGQTTVAWVTSKVATAVGLNPPVWSIKATVLQPDTGKTVTTVIATPVVNGARAQSGNVDIEPTGTDNYVVSVSTANGYVLSVLGSTGAIIGTYPGVQNDATLVSQAHQILPQFVYTGQPLGSVPGDFFDAITGKFITVPGFDGSQDHDFLTDNGCGTSGLVLTENGDPEVGSPNSRYQVVKGVLTRTAFPAFDWFDTNFRTLTSAGVVVTRQDNAGNTFLELLSGKNAAVVWKIGADKIDPGSVRVVLGVISVSNNSKVTVLVDPSTGKVMTGLSADAQQILGGDDSSADWFPVDVGTGRYYVGLDNSTAYLLTPKDGVCR